ncbi:MAG: Trk family potassium uptake protein [Solobacterium sp.]|nr:Trk family potassium uptake protein [Solobacterium sp.]
MRKYRIFLQDHLNSFRTILIGFFLVILCGMCLLLLPVSRHGEVSVIDALFTSASAVCVTGLVVYDTATQWTLFGKTVILLLIQIGGFGVIALTAATLMLTGKRIGILQRVFLQDSVSAHHIGGIVRFTKFFLCRALEIELLGALLLLPGFAMEFGIVKGIGYAIFHAVSAFCNAGFDLMGVHGQFSSLTYYADHAWLTTVIELLIVVGGIGFLTWDDLLQNRRSLKKLRMQTKVILVSTAILILIPFLYFYFIEFRMLGGKERLLVSLFQSITPRTAGFSTTDYGTMSEGGLLITIFLMITGGAPGSTAGGMKVTTIAVLLLSSSAFLQKRENVNCFKRRIEDDVIRSAFTLMTLYLGLLMIGSLVISTVESIPVIPAMFESASALGTVGLTTGITTGLCNTSKLLLIFFMYFGRTGGMTLAYAMASNTKKEYSRMPAEKLSVG